MNLLIYVLVSIHSLWSFHIMSYRAWTTESYLVYLGGRCLLE